MEKHIIVTGGNGFLGKEICRQASLHNLPVISLSRSGKPDHIVESQFETTTWAKADVFEPETWVEYLDGCSAIIHCIGILEEQPDKDITYKKMIFISAKTAGIVAKANGISKFVYISAGAGAPETPAAYMVNKIAAEEFLTGLNLDLTIIKPGMLYGPDEPQTLVENQELQKLLLDPHIGPHIRPNRPLPVDAVAKAALYAAITPGFSRKLSVDNVEELVADVIF